MLSPKSFLVFTVFDYVVIRNVRQRSSTRPGQRCSFIKTMIVGKIILIGYSSTVGSANCLVFIVPQNSIYVQQKKKTHLGLKQLLGKWWSKNKTPWQNRQTDGIVFFFGWTIPLTLIHLHLCIKQTLLSKATCIQTIHFCQYMCSLGIEPTTFCAANAMLYHWATGTLIKQQNTENHSLFLTEEL